MPPRLSIERRARWWWPGLLLALICGPASAWAQESPAETDDGTLAEQAWREGRFAEAAHRSIDAYRREPRHTVLLYNAARAFHRAQLCTDALRWYRTYLDLAELDADRRDVAARLADAIATGVDLDCPGQDKVAMLPQPVTPQGADPVPTLAHASVRHESAGRHASARHFWGWALVGTGTAALATGGWLVHAWADAPANDPSALRQRDTGMASAGMGIAAAALGLWLLVHEPAQEPRLLEESVLVLPPATGETSGAMPPSGSVSASRAGP
jgi:hypothetical protein